MKQEDEQFQILCATVNHNPPQPKRNQRTWMQRNRISLNKLTATRQSQVWLIQRASLVTTINSSHKSRRLWLFVENAHEFPCPRIVPNRWKVSVFNPWLLQHQTSQAVETWSRDLWLFKLDEEEPPRLTPTNSARATAILRVLRVTHLSLHRLGWRLSSQWMKRGFECLSPMSLEV